MLYSAMPITLCCAIVLWSQHFPSLMSVSPLITTHPYPSVLTGRAHSGSRRSPNPPQCLPDTLAQGFPLSVHTKPPRSAAFYWFCLLPDKSFCLLVHLLAFWLLSSNQEADGCRYIGYCSKKVFRLPPRTLKLTRNSSKDCGPNSVNVFQTRSVSSKSLLYFGAWFVPPWPPLFTDCITPLGDE